MATAQVKGFSASGSSALVFATLNVLPARFGCAAQGSRLVKLLRPLEPPSESRTAQLPVTTRGLLNRHFYLKQ